MNQKTDDFFPRFIALLLTISLSFPGPALAMGAKQQETSQNVLPTVSSGASRTSSQPESINQVGVLSDHSWSKAWDLEAEEKALQELEAKKKAKHPTVRSTKEVTTHLRQTELTDDPNNPIAAGLEDRLRQAGLEEPNQGSFRKGLMHGAVGAAVITAGLVGAYEAGQRAAVPPLNQQPPAKVAQLEPVPVPGKPAPVVPILPDKESPVKPAPVAEAPPIAKAPLFDQIGIDKALAQKMRDWQEKTRKFFADQKMDDAVDAPGGFSVQAYRSYKPQEDHPSSRYLGVDRFWSYDMAEPVNNFETLWSIIYSAKNLFNPL